MIKIRITQCLDGLMWYSSHIDEIFTAYREYDDSYLVRAAGGYSNIIYKTDCEILKENK
jgi:hypothetical protein